MLRIIAIGSGNGNLLRELKPALQPDELVGVIADQPHAGILDLHPTSIYVRHRPGETREEFDGRLHEKVAGLNPDYILLVGYKRILSPWFVGQYPKRILNLHPALLPAYKGFDPQKRALEAGETHTGCTVHYVDEGVDTGEILTQETVPILPGDSLKDLLTRLRPAEIKAYTKAITLLRRNV